MTLTNGDVITDELAVADAHPLGARPFGREQYLSKFTLLADGVVNPAEQQRFLDATQDIDDVNALNLRVLPEVLEREP